MAAIFKSPQSFIYHTGKDLIVNGRQIYSEIKDSITQFEGQHYEAFGEDVGEALAKLILGQKQGGESEWETNPYWTLS